jgi:hypothetical protein
MPEIVPLPADYAAWLAELKTLIHFVQAVLAQLSNGLLDNCRGKSQRVQERTFITTNISKPRRSGRECRNLVAMDGESFPHYCELDAGNLYQRDGVNFMTVKLNLLTSFKPSQALI